MKRSAKHKKDLSAGKSPSIATSDDSISDKRKIQLQKKSEADATTQANETKSI